jgi:hypothetical protein
MDYQQFGCITKLTNKKTLILTEVENELSLKAQKILNNMQQQIMKQEVHPLMILSLMMASPKPSLDHSSCAHYVTLQKNISHIQV